MNSNERLHDLDVKCSALLLFNKVRGKINKNLVKDLSPKISLISVGENKFGHPTIYTLEVLKDTRILRTDIHNSIKFVINAKGYKIFTFDSKAKKYIRYND